VPASTSSTSANGLPTQHQRVVVAGVPRRAGGCHGRSRPRMCAIRCGSSQQRLLQQRKDLAAQAYLAWWGSSAAFDETAQACPRGAWGETSAGIPRGFQRSPRGGVCTVCQRARRHSGGYRAGAARTRAGSGAVEGAASIAAAHQTLSPAAHRCTRGALRQRREAQRKHQSTSYSKPSPHFVPFPAGYNRSIDYGSGLGPLGTPAPGGAGKQSPGDSVLYAVCRLGTASLKGLLGQKPRRSSPVAQARRGGLTLKV
jgi:hypothetical protein